jgi:hypothetical protein
MLFAQYFVLEVVRRKRCLGQSRYQQRMRAQHYAIAQHFHLLAEAELKAATSSPAEVEASAPCSTPVSIN